jgi:FkbM family methyltransferase
MRSLKQIVLENVNAGMRKFGFEVRRVRNPVEDIRRLTKVPKPIVFDVGANIGQSVKVFRECFKQPLIHAFEPSPRIFSMLEARTAGVPNLRVVNMALGAHSGAAQFFENTVPDMSSLLPLGPEGWGDIGAQYDVKVSTIDEYCESNRVERIDVLKLDTQGYDLEVLKGAQGLMLRGRIRLVLMEFIFSEMYKGLPRLDEIWKLLADHGFSLVTFYRFYYRNGAVSWTDALFAHRDLAPMAGDEAHAAPR